MATNTEKIVVQVVVKGGKQLDNLTKKTGAATKSVGGLNKGMLKMAGGVAIAAAAFRGITKIISDSIKTFKNFEFQMAKVRAVSGASNLDFQKLSQTAEDLGRSTFFTATQVAELQTNYAKLGFTTKEILQAQEATLLLATATGSDLARAAIVAGAAVRGFGLDASETGRVTDVMTLAFASSALDIEKWQTSMTKVAPIAAGMNIPLEETAAIMGVLTDAGIEASIAGTSMRNIFLQMKNPASKLSQFLGFTVRSSEDLAKAMDKLSKASGDTLDGLVKVRQVAAFNVMVKGAERVEKLTQKLIDAEGAAKRMADIVGDNLEGATKRFNSAWEGFLINLSEGFFGDKIRNVLEKMASLFNVFSDFIDIPVSEKLEEQRIEMNLLGGAIQRVWKDEKQRIRLIEELQIKYPDYFKDLDAEKVAYEDLEKAMASANGEFLKTIEQQVMREEVRAMTKEIREQQKAQDEANESIVGMLTGLDKVGTTYLKTTNATSTLRDAQDELNQQYNDGIIDSGEFLAGMRALDTANGNASRSTKKLTELEEKRAKILKEIDDLGLTGGDSGGVVEPSGSVGGDKDENKDAEEMGILEKVKIQNLIQLVQLQEDLLAGKITLKEFEEKNRANEIALLKAVIKESNALNLSFVETLNLKKKLNLLELEEQESKKEGEEDKKKSIKQQIDSTSDLGDQLIKLAGEDEKMQGIRKVGIQISAAAAIANNLLALSNAAVGVTEQSKLLFPYNIIAMAGTIGTVLSLFANIKAMKDSFGDGGIIETFANGGLVQGKSHAQGGEKFAVGGRVVELEGGEAVINKRSTSRSTSMFSSQLSAMNAAGGGVKFADGGLLNQPSFSQQQFNALGQNQMMGAMGNSGKVTVVEADITSSQNTVSVIQSQATI
jgi:TP901 family phage tail tape measure protein